MIANHNGVVLRCEGIAKRFGPAVALDGFDLHLRHGDIMAMLGPSGCGKTTALRVIAGFERPDRGSVWVGDRRVAGDGAWVPPERRRIGMVFQDWALFPHLDVWGNVSFGLKDTARDRVAEVLELVRLDGLETRMPHELSGGQQQRVAIARALAPGPEVILLDEPFSNLDASLRARVRAEVRSVLRAAGATAVFVTHDQEEALSIADHLVVTARGRVLQAGPPHQVYGAPANLSVAALVGEANIISGEVRAGVAHTTVGAIPAPGLAEGSVDIMIRPESVGLERDEGGEGRIVEAEFYGHDQLVRARLANGTTLTARLLGPRPDLAHDTPVKVTIGAPVHFFRAGDAVHISPYCGITAVSAR